MTLPLVLPLSALAQRCSEKGHRFGLTVSADVKGFKSRKNFGSLFRFFWSLIGMMILYDLI